MADNVRYFSREAAKWALTDGNQISDGMQQNFIDALESGSHRRLRVDDFQKFIVANFYDGVGAFGQLFQGGVGFGSSFQAFKSIRTSDDRNRQRAESSDKGNVIAAPERNASALLGSVGKLTKTLQGTEAAKDGGRRQQKHGSFFAGTSGFGLRGRWTSDRFPPLRGVFSFATFLWTSKEKLILNTKGIETPNQNHQFNLPTAPSCTVHFIVTSVKPESIM